MKATQDARNRATLRRAYRWMLKHAGYATPPGRAACALELARAEAWAADNDVAFSWEGDAANADDSWMGEQERQQPHTWEACHASAHGGVVSLSGIVDADDVDRRLIEAELAAQLRAQLPLPRRSVA